MVLIVKSDCMTAGRLLYLHCRAIKMLFHLVATIPTICQPNVDVRRVFGHVEWNKTMSFNRELWNKVTILILKCFHFPNVFWTLLLRTIWYSQFLNKFSAITTPVCARQIREEIYYTTKGSIIFPFNNAVQWCHAGCHGRWHAGSLVPLPT